MKSLAWAILAGLIAAAAPQRSARGEGAAPDSADAGPVVAGTARFGEPIHMSAWPGRSETWPRACSRRRPICV
ncbi:MAG: hypothetical protein ACREJ3_06115, partial [Polyangiaceae bacterium]